MRLRVLIAVTHLLGAGHLARAAALARAFARTGHEATLVSGGMPAPLIRTEGSRLVQLPPVRVEGTAFSRLLDEASAPVDEVRMQARRAGLLGALRDTRPDVVITELFPFGRRVLAGEFEALLDAARVLDPRPLLLASLRDVLVWPSRPDRVAEAHLRFLDRYDAALVHGDEAFLPLDASWALTPEVRTRLRYTGYVDEGEPAPPVSRGSEVLVSGGSGAGALPLYRAALAAARLDADRPWRVLVGRGLPEAGFDALRESAPGNATVERARPDFRALLARASASVSQAGYNTVVDLLATSTPAVLVPFEDGGETEQRLRTERLAESGFAEVLSADGLTPESLAAAVERSAGRAAPRLPIRLDGAETSVRIVEAMQAARILPRLQRDRPPVGWGGTIRGMVEGAGSRPRPSDEPSSTVRRLGFTRSTPSAASGGPPPAGRRPVPPAAGEDMHPPPSAALLSPHPNWSPLDDALARLGDRGVPARLWWRDDDACRDTPELRRLLALRARFGLPLALAAIPASLDGSLIAALAGEPEVSVLVHGLAHLSHTPEGEKRAEFGAHRPLAALKADAAAGLVLARAALGQKLLPVFVPPWNRIAPALIPELPALGYRGLSAFGGRAVTAGGFARVDAHLDPVDWRGTRGLADPAGLVALLAEKIAESEGVSVGLLTHHLAHDEAVWGFVDALLDRLAASGTVRYPFAEELFFFSDDAPRDERLRDRGVDLP